MLDCRRSQRDAGPSCNLQHESVTGVFSLTNMILARVDLRNIVHRDDVHGYFFRAYLVTIGNCYTEHNISVRIDRWRLERRRNAAFGSSSTTVWAAHLLPGVLKVVQQLICGASLFVNTCTPRKALSPSWLRLRRGR